MNGNTPRDRMQLRGWRGLGCGGIIGILLLALVLAAFGFGYLANFDMQQIVRWVPWSS